MRAPHDKITIEPYDPTASVAAQLLTELSADLASRYEGWDGSSDFRPEDVFGSRGVFVLAWMDGEAVGCGAIRPTDDAETAELKRMYTRPHARGKGVGRRMLQELERRARNFGYTRLILETGWEQPEAIALYTRAGFDRIPCYGAYADEKDSLCFAKQL